MRSTKTSRGGKVVNFKPEDDPSKLFPLSNAVQKEDPSNFPSSIEAVPLPTRSPPVANLGGYAKDEASWTEGTDVFSSEEVIGKVALVGCYSSGKSTLLKRLLEAEDWRRANHPPDAAAWQRFTSTLRPLAVPPTVGVDSVTCELAHYLPGVSIKLQFLDTAGLGRYQTPLKKATKDASVVLCVFDIGEAESLHEATHAILPNLLHAEAPYKVVVVANKVDLLPHSDDSAFQAEKRLRDREIQHELLLHPEAAFRHSVSPEREDHRDPNAGSTSSPSSSSTPLSRSKIRDELLHSFPGAAYVETSALTGTGVALLLQHICHCVLKAEGFECSDDDDRSSDSSETTYPSLQQSNTTQAPPSKHTDPSNASPSPSPYDRFSMKPAGGGEEDEVDVLFSPADVSAEAAGMGLQAGADGARQPSTPPLPASPLPPSPGESEGLELYNDILEGLAAENEETKEAAVIEEKEVSKDEDTIANEYRERIQILQESRQQQRETAPPAPKGAKPAGADIFNQYKQDREQYRKSQGKTWCCC